MKPKIMTVLPLAVAALAVVFVAVHPALAQTGGGVTGGNLRGLQIGLFQGTDIFTPLANVLNFVLLIAGILAFIYAIYGGFVYLTAGGDAAKAGNGRTIIINAIIGIVLISLSLALVRFFIGRTQNQFQGSGQAPTRILRG